MIPLLNYPNYFVDETESNPRIWSARRAGCAGVFLDIITNCKFRCVRIADKKKVMKLKIIAHLVWEAHNKTQNIDRKIIGYIDGDCSNDRYENLYAKERYIRDESGNVIVSFS
jgi:hypothetical protein